MAAGGAGGERRLTFVQFKLSLFDAVIFTADRSARRSGDGDAGGVGGGKQTSRRDSFMEGGRGPGRGYFAQAHHQRASARVAVSQARRGEGRLPHERTTKYKLSVKEHTRQYLNCKHRDTRNDIRFVAQASRHGYNCKNKMRNWQQVCNYINAPKFIDAVASVAIK